MKSASKIHATQPTCSKSASTHSRAVSVSQCEQRLDNSQQNIQHIRHGLASAGAPHLEHSFVDTNQIKVRECNIRPSNEIGEKKHPDYEKDQVHPPPSLDPDPGVCGLYINTEPIRKRDEEHLKREGRQDPAWKLNYNNSIFPKQGNDCSSLNVGSLQSQSASSGPEKYYIAPGCATSFSPTKDETQHFGEKGSLISSRKRRYENSSISHSINSKSYSDETSPGKVLFII